MCDYRPIDDCNCIHKEKKSNRRCNNCGERLTDNSPNWFQCSDYCQAQVRERYEEKRKQEEGGW